MARGERAGFKRRAALLPPGWGLSSAGHPWTHRWEGGGSGLTSEELAGVEDLDHLVALQLVGATPARRGVAAVEHAALALPLDQHALPAAVQEDATLQVPKQLPCHLPLPLTGDGVGRREAHQLQALGPTQLTAGQAGLAQGQAAALGARGGGLAHQLAPVVEADDHLGEGCGETGTGQGPREKGPRSLLCQRGRSLPFSQGGGGLTLGIFGILGKFTPPF